ncbi:AraC family transcriptional regulator [Enterococcus sp.]|uniref:AraC family transcriptional regulator n=1 Tax=Enterococcus sp. TaxID=35783 RepID=UPI002FC6175C
MRYLFDHPDKRLPLFVDSIGYDCEQEDVRRPEGYPYIHWIHTKEGQGEITIDGQQILLTAGTGVFMNQQIPHQYQQTIATWKTAYFTFGGALAQEILALLQLDSILVVTENIAEIDAFILSLSEQITRATPGYQYDISGTIYQFLMLLKKNSLSQTNDDYTYQTIVAPLQRYIETHFTESLSDADFSARLDYSTQYITRVFKHALQMTPSQYLVNYRIRQAKVLLLQDRQLPLADVAQQVGFQNVNYFITTFRKLEQITPHQFRQKYR